MTGRRILASTFIPFLLLGTAQGQPAVYVDDSASGTNDGLSWCDAYVYLQDALAAAAASGGAATEIRVARGTYTPDRDAVYPDGTRDRQATFQLLSGVAIRGGYAGCGAPDPDERDVTLYETILSGDLAGDDVEVASPHELLEQPTRVENSYHIVTGSGTDETAVLDGVTVTGGHAGAATDNRHERGGGLYNDRGDPTIVDCTFAANSASSVVGRAYGGAMYNSGGNPTLTNCAFTNNAAASSEDYVSGGAMYSSGDATLINCAFTNNVIAGNDGWVFGGAMYDSGGATTLVDCTFTGNSASSVSGRAFGGAMYGSGDATLTNCAFANNVAVSSDGYAFGGGMSRSSGAPNLRDCTFTGNSASSISGRAFGGAIYSSGDPTFTSCAFRSNAATSGDSRAYGGAMYSTGKTVLTKCTFVENWADGSWLASGGGVSIYNSEATLTGCIFLGNYLQSASHRYGGGLHNSGGSPTLTNCTFLGNSGGGLRNDYGIAILTNCIFWRNDGTSESDQIDLYDSWIFVNYSCIQGLTGSLGGAGNIGLDPRFVDPWGTDGVIGTEDDAVRLLSDSPCIDAGDNSADIDAFTGGLQALPSTDLEGSPRFIDSLAVPDTGFGKAPVVDMGAFEHVLDCNGNGVADDIDISEGTSDDCNANGIPEECESDCNKNGLPDACEPECNGNGVPDDCDIAEGTSRDCNENAVPDECDVVEETSEDCTGNGIPDECEVDCNENGVADSCDVAGPTSSDCNGDGIPDECLTAPIDCNNNGLVDECETADGITPDLNGNWRPDECEPPVLFVDVEAVGLNNGTSWQDAFNDLQDALSVATESLRYVEEIWVAAGTYRATGLDGSPEATFRMISGVHIYGGFAGGEINRDQRDALANNTILSGDLRGDDDPHPTSDCCATLEVAGCDNIACTIAVCADRVECCSEQWDETCAHMALTRCCDVCGNICDNTHHVVTAGGTDRTAVLDGFAITGGYAGGESGSGGGMDSRDGSPTLTGCRFVRNVARYEGGGMYTGGYDAAPTLTNCIFTENVAHQGGGMHIDYGGDATLLRCSFTANSAVRGGGMGITGGGPTLADCIFINNSALAFGGGVYSDGRGGQVMNCMFSGNSSMRGGGIYNTFSNRSLPVTNCTLSGNRASDSGGGIFNYSSDALDIGNCILWGNSDSGGQNQSAQIHSERSTPTLGHCCVQGWSGSLGGIGNFGDAPLFVPGPVGYHYLSQIAAGQGTDSPCVDAGNDTAVNLHLGTLTTRSDKVPDTGIVDIGYHYPVIDLPWVWGDIDGDGRVTLRDFAEFQICFTGTIDGPAELSARCRIFDVKVDAAVNLGDYIAFELALNP